MAGQEDEEIVVQSLVGKNQLKFYLRCLKSLVTLCHDRIELQLHTDGSLSRKDKEFIHSELNETTITITDSSENSSRVLDYLQGRPNCQKFRKNSIWGIEFFDPIYAFPEDPICFYLDADILFLRPFTGLFDRYQVKRGAVFLKDTQWDAYCFRPWQMLMGKKKPQVVKGITTGLIFWDKSVIDWDYLEWFIGEDHLHKIPEWIMPTAQAGLANRCQSKTVCPKQIRNLYPNAKISSDTFGLHLLGSYREQWLHKIQGNANQDEKGISVEDTIFQPCQKQGILGYTGRQVKRWVNTRLNIW